MTMSTLYDTPADTLEGGDYVCFEHESVIYEGVVLSLEDAGDDLVTIGLANEGDYGDRVEIDVRYDKLIPVLANDYSDVEV